VSRRATRTRRVCRGNFSRYFPGRCVNQATPGSSRATLKRRGRKFALHPHAPKSTKKPGRCDCSRHPHWPNIFFFFKRRQGSSNFERRCGNRLSATSDTKWLGGSGARPQFVDWVQTRNLPVYDRKTGGKCSGDPWQELHAVVRIVGAGLARANKDDGGHHRALRQTEQQLMGCFVAIGCYNPGATTPLPGALTVSTTSDPANPRATGGSVA